LNIRYVLPRFIRHFMPDSVVRFFLRRGLIIHPGLETSNPAAAIERYEKVFASAGQELAGKRTLIFGYGGNFAVGCALLRLGARQVVLCEKYAPPDHVRNQSLLPEYEEYLQFKDGRVLPATDKLRLLQADIRHVAQDGQLAPVDYVLTTSVYEHLDDVEGITRSLAMLTNPSGMQLHFIDMRDHFFKYPFEMLAYTEHVWRSWLNPTSNLNRYRLTDYQRVFEALFKNVEITVLARDDIGFEAMRERIRPEFLSGDPQIDAATQIQVLACYPKTGSQNLKNADD